MDINDTKQHKPMSLTNKVSGTWGHWTTWSQDNCHTQIPHIQHHYHLRVQNIAIHKSQVGLEHLFSKKDAHFSVIRLPIMNASKNLQHTRYEMQTRKHIMKRQPPQKQEDKSRMTTTTTTTRPSSSQSKLFFSNSHPHAIIFINSSTKFLD